MKKKESIVKSWVSEDVYKLLLGAGKFYTNELKLMALNDLKFLDLLVKIFLTNEKKLCWHAGWVIFKIADTNKNLLEKHLFAIIEKLPKMKYDQQIHGVLRTVKHYDIIDEKQQGILFDEGIKFIRTEKYPPYMKYFSIVIIEKICNYYPELKKEFIFTIEEALPHWETNYIIKFGKKKLKEYAL